MNTYTFTKQEEMAHAITHGIGVLLSLAGLLLLINYANLDKNPWQYISVIIFGSSMLIMYLTSTVVHSLPNGRWKDIFQIFDHASIFLFIAGTYTPILLVHLREEMGMLLFGIVWGIAIAGIIFKIFFVKKFLVLSTILYVSMGWLIMFVWQPLTAVMHENGIQLLLTGGLFYTFGAIFYVWRSFPYHHAVWHLFVLAGSAFHFLTIFYYVL
ncbi:PAQR family membrane homeostasis protein TrhA [Virgibacillus oceani]|uniref:Hemolysin III family protein n=1 Tax=Virgibacillus oceani TaxID=1479511 RepID=A0A917H7P2_9BACI|nr:hemolysin III family protein [Virgibacillus oceani]GGG70339.1 hemolysin III family protein [Virgibacillus oceani]